MSLMRRAFKFPECDFKSWFPGHMHKGIQQMQRRIGDMDCILEIHDARIPFSGRNPLFGLHAQMRPHILVLNKIIDETLNVIGNSERYHRNKDDSLNLLVVGIPNVGKSSFINYLRNTALGRKGRATKVGAAPGVTRSVLEKIRVCDEPLMFLYDTPGVVTPRIESTEIAFKLGLCNTINSKLVGEEALADYLLYILNSQEKHIYVKLYGLDEPSDRIMQVLTAVASKHNKTCHHKVNNEYKILPDYVFAAQRMLLDFNQGVLGLVCLDNLIINNELVQSV